MQFVHKSTRLSCDLGRAFRFLTVSDMISKWSGSASEIELKKGGTYKLSLELEGFSEPIATSGSKILSYEREKHVQVSWKDSLHPEENYNLMIQLMPCRSDTEYCSELHLMFKCEGRELSDNESEVYSKLFAELLEMLRKYQNKDWVIQDGDLSMSWLRGSGL